MTIYTYITNECKNQSEKYGIFQRIKKFQELIKQTQTTIGLEPLEDSKILYKKRVGDYRLIVGKKRLDQGETDECYVFWKIYKRQEKGEYEKLLKDSRIFEDKFERFLESEKDLGNSVLSSQPKEDDNPSKKYNVQSLREFLENSQFKLSRYKFSGEWRIYESKDWIEKIKKFQDRRETIHKLVQDIVEETASTQERSSENKYYQYSESKRVGILYKTLRNEKIIFLSSLFENKEEMESLVERQNIKTFSNSEDVMRRSKRAYPAFYLADFNFWSDIEDQDEVASLALSGEEMEILYNSRDYPLFINGRPGSGKTVLLLYRFADLLLSFFENQIDVSPIYLTYSEELRDRARKDIESILGAMDPDKKFVKEAKVILDKSFVVFHEYLREMVPDVEKRFPKEKRLTFSEFENWYKETILQSPKKTKFLTAEVAWHVICAYIKGWGFEEDEYLDPEGYAELPKKSKSVSGETFKQVYKDIWDAYKKWLKEENRWDDQDLVREALRNALAMDSPAHSVVFCDEAQDFTRNELRLIIRLSVFSRLELSPYEMKKAPIAFAGDPFQTINPTGFNWSTVKDNFYQVLSEQIRQSIIPPPRLEELYHNYRSNGGIVRFCNLIHLIRGIVFERDNLKPQKVYFEDDGTETISRIVYFEVDINLIKELGDEFTILLPCQKDEEEEFSAKDEFLRSIAFDNNSEASQSEKDENRSINRSILSSFSAKGLEFSLVVLYKFGQNCLDEYPNLINLLDLDIQSQKISDDQKIPLEYFINRLYVAASRAKKQLIILDTLEGVKGFWKKFESNQTFRYIEKYQEFHKPNDNSQFEWDEDTIMPIQGGDAHDLKEQIDSFEGYIQRAKMYYDKGKLEKNPRYMGYAAADYKKADEILSANKCMGYKYLFEKNFQKAGDWFKEALLFENSKNAYWEGKLFNRLVELDSVSDNDPWKKAAKFVVNKKDFSFEETKDLLADFSKLTNENAIYPDPAWREVFTELYKKITIDENENKLSDKEWKHYYKQIQPSQEKGFIDSKNSSFVILKIWSTNYPEKLKVIKDSGNNPDLILKYYDRFAKDNLNGYFDIIKDALKRKNRIEDWESLVDKYPSVDRYVEIILHFARLASGKEKISTYADKLKNLLEKSRSIREEELRQNIGKLFDGLIQMGWYYDELEKIIISFPKKFSAVRADTYLDLLSYYIQKEIDKRFINWWNKFEEIFDNNNKRKYLTGNKRFNDLIEKLQSRRLFDKLETLVRMSKSAYWYVDLLKGYIEQNNQNQVEKWVEEIKTLIGDLEFKKDFMSHYDEVWDLLFDKNYLNEAEFLLLIFPDAQKYKRLLILYINRDNERFSPLLSNFRRFISTERAGELSDEFYTELEREFIKSKKIDLWEKAVDTFPSESRYFSLFGFWVQEKSQLSNFDNRIESFLVKFFAYLLKISKWRIALETVKSGQLPLVEGKNQPAVKLESLTPKIHQIVCLLRALLDWKPQYVPQEIISYLEEEKVDSDEYAKCLKESERKRILEIVKNQEQILIAPKSSQEKQIHFRGQTLYCTFKPEKVFFRLDNEPETITITLKTLLAHGSDDEVETWIEPIEQSEDASKFSFRPWGLICQLRKMPEGVEINLHDENSKSRLLSAIIRVMKPE